MHLLILEDDRVWSAMLETALHQAGHTCLTCPTVAAMKAALRQNSFDLLLLDWNLPDATGYDLLLWAKEHIAPCPPIIMVTSRSGSEDIVNALNAGADDFIVKPCEAGVLQARISAVMRRTHPPDESPARSEQLSGANFNHSSRTVEIAGRAVKLTEKEFSLALILFRNIGRPVGRAHLMDRVWGGSPDMQTRTLDVHISKIRNRLGLRAEKGFRLLPVYNFGYRLEHLVSAPALENAG